MKNNYIKTRWMRRTVIIIFLPIATLAFSLVYTVKSLASGVGMGCQEFIDSMQENFYGFGEFLQSIIKSWNAK